MKPFKGLIHEWYKNFFNKEAFPGMNNTLGYNIIGKPEGHPQFSGWIITSAVVKHDEKTGEIETLNSRYKLV